MPVDTAKYQEFLAEFGQPQQLPHHRKFSRCSPRSAPLLNRDLAPLYLPLHLCHRFTREFILSEEPRRGVFLFIGGRLGQSTSPLSHLAQSQQMDKWNRKEE